MHIRASLQKNMSRVVTISKAIISMDVNIYLREDIILCYNIYLKITYDIILIQIMHIRV